MNRTASLAVLCALLAAFAPVSHADTIFTVRQTFSVTNLPKDARLVKGWFWMPEDRPEQKVLELRIVEAPESLRITRDTRYGRAWLHAEATVDSARPLKVVTEFKVLRRAVSGLADAAKTTHVRAEHRRAFVQELRRDEKRMEVTPKLQKLADKLAGDEQNPVRQARKFFDYVIAQSDHYSKWGVTPKGKCLGDAMECLAGTGDCCSDQHALFIALCRARGIPCRMMFGSRLMPGNEGKEYDPGYRCWPIFFAPGLGWVPVDISSADANPGAEDTWFGGLDEHRIEWAEGRDFDFEPRSQVRPDLVIPGWLEVDGKPRPASLVRTLVFQRQELSSTSTAKVAAPAKP